MLDIFIYGLAVIGLLSSLLILAMLVLPRPGKKELDKTPPPPFPGRLGHFNPMGNIDPATYTEHIYTPEQIMGKKKEAMQEEAFRAENAIMQMAFQAYDGKKFKMGWLLDGLQGSWHEEAVNMAHARLEEKGWKIEVAGTIPTTKQTPAGGVYYWYGSSVEDKLEKIFNSSSGVPIQ